MIQAALTVLAIVGILQESAPATKAGMSAAGLAKIDEAVAGAMGRGEIPGAVVLVGRHGKVVYEKAFGFRALEPAKEPMTADTIFDWASLTKVVATATAVMQLVEEKKVGLEDPLTRHLPDFARDRPEGPPIRIVDCLTHTAGLPADDPLEIYFGSPAEIFSRKNRRTAARAPGQAFVYSDVGFEYLGRVVEAVSGKPLDEVTRERILAPLGMKDSGFRRKGAAGLPTIERIAPTERVDGAWLRGIVHDPRARALGGVAGHAGLFGTARDLANYAIAILAGGGPILKTETLKTMVRPHFVGGTPSRDLRGLGWDMATSYSGARGAAFRRGSFGHTGFTGTSIWIDPRTDCFVILLTSFLHPDGQGDVRLLRSQVATAAAQAIESMDPKEAAPWVDADWPYLAEALEGKRWANRSLELSPVEGAATSRAAAAPAAGRVLSGADVLESRGFAPLAHRTVGLLTNQTGFTRSGQPTIDLLLSRQAKDAGVRLVTLFSPEHGIRGDEDDRVAGGVDARTGLPVVSLYTLNTRRPDVSSLWRLDALVIDLQDVGCRFYTYLASLGYCLEECAKAGVEVVVLDRPDPIGADRAEGPLLDEGKSSFVGYHRMPVRTGMTMGECARMFNEERKIGAALTVVPLEGYAREMWYEETGLTWIGPSPNIRSVDGAALYPGLCLLELTNISVGRGTKLPFEWFGAPWMDGERIAATLAGRGIPGVRFEAMDATPAQSAHSGELCRGVRIAITDRHALRPVRLGFEIACALRDLHGAAWKRNRFPDLLGNAATLALFERGAPAGEIEASWRAPLAEFEARRARFLLYGDPNKKPK